MYKIEGFWGVEPKIKDVSFPKRGYMSVKLEDGREIIIPLSSFPSIKKVPLVERKKWYLTAGGVTWDSCPEVIHIEQILGNPKKYQHER